jgi:bacteriorhodopsin
MSSQYQDTKIDTKIVLSALWIAMLFVFAYVDIFGFLRADVLQAALDGKVATTGFEVNQMFLTATLLYIAVPVLMLVLSLLLRPRINRILNVVVSLIYIVTIIVAALGEDWAYHLVGSANEVVILAVIAGTAWKWPSEAV